MTTITELAPRRLRAALGRPVDASGLAFWRAGFGAIVAWDAWRFLDHGWVGRYFADKEFYFTYWPFGWVRPLPEPVMVILFVVLGLAGITLALGLWYRTSAITVFGILSYVFLIEKARYLNHEYLLILLAFLMIFLPAGRAYSLDARRRSRSGADREPTVPAWSLWLVRFQIGVPYVFGGIAKLNADWLAGRPLGDWLGARTDVPLLGPLFEHEPVVLAMAWGALLLDLTVVAFLLDPRTRTAAFGAAVAFHLLNDRLFSIGVFPWAMILGTVVFFEADWPRRLREDLHRRPRSRAVVGGWIGLGLGFWLGANVPGSVSLVRAAVGAVAGGVLGYHVGARRPPTHPPAEQASRPVRPITTWLLAAWVLVQVVVPLRHLAIPGSVHWSEEGHRWAWHMKLRDKDATAEFVVVDPDTGQRWEVDEDDHLTARQRSKMSGRPDMLVQFAHHLEEVWRGRGHRDVVVTADVWASLNGHPEQRLVDPARDLTEVSYPWWPPAPWITTHRP